MFGQHGVNYRDGGDKRVSLKEPKYSMIQLAGIIFVVIFVIYTETSLFTEMNDITRAGVIIGFSIVGTVLGVKKGGLKEIIAETKKILDSSEVDEVALSKIENYMHLLSVKAGYIWEELGRIVPTKISKIKKILQKKIPEVKELEQELTEAIEKPEISNTSEKVEVVPEKKENPII